MRTFRYLAPMILTFAVVSAAAQPLDEHDSLRPLGKVAEQAAPQTSAATPFRMGPGMMGGQYTSGMMNMMRGGMGLMMMGAMGMIDHVEGRIAFLKTELKITEVQTPAWNAFADTLRANAKKLGEVRSAMQTREGAARPQAVTERLDLEERWLASRLEGTRATKAALGKLYGVLSAEQKQAADELIAPNIGVGAMMMSMAAGVR